MHRPVPMTAVRGMGPLPAKVEASEGGRGLRRLFGRLELPVDLAARPDRKILLRDMIALFADAAAFVGDPLLGFKVGAAMSPSDFGPWAAYALAADTLDGCLRRASRSLRYHQTGGSLSLSSDGALARYTYRLDAPSGLDHRQHGDHVLPSLLAAIGAMPDRTGVRPGSRSSRCTAAASVCCRMSWRARSGRRPRRSRSCSRQRCSKPVRPAWAVRRPGPGAACASSRAPGRLTPSPIPSPRSPMPVLLDRRFDLEGVAGKLNLGVRTLQRRLEQDGLAYRAILGRIRHLHALDLLADSGLPVTEIAWLLGYEDPAHFSRAFGRAAAMPPVRYRQLARHGRDAGPQRG